MKKPLPEVQVPRAAGSTGRVKNYASILEQKRGNVKMSGVNSCIAALEKKYGCAIIVPRRAVEPKSVWVAYSSQKPNLPEAVEDSVQQLALKCGVSEDTIRTLWSRYQSGKRKTSRYHKVYID